MLNLETRRLIVAVLYTIPCVVGGGIHVAYILQGVFMQDWYNWILFPLCLTGTWIGFDKIRQTI